MGFFGFILALGAPASNGSSSSPFLISTSSRGTPSGSMSSPIGARSLFRVSVGPTSELLCHTRVFDADWDERFSSVPSHQSLEMHPHFMTNFALHWKHETTVGSHVEILSSFARDCSSIAQHFVCTRESSVQRSTQTVFIETLKLPSSTLKDTLTTGFSKESSISCSIWTKVQSTCVHHSSCVQIHGHPFKQLRATHGTKIKASN